MRVTFCGHRTLTETNILYEELKKILEGIFQIAQTMQEKLVFYCGGYGAFDSLAAKGVAEIRKRYTEVKSELIFVTPYILGEQIKNPLFEKEYDEIVYPPLENVPFRFAIIRRNEWMVEKSDLIVACVFRNWGGAARTLAYAQRKGETNYKYRIDSLISVPLQGFFLPFAERYVKIDK